MRQSSCRTPPKTYVARFKRTYRCKPPRQEPHKDPLLGLDCLRAFLDAVRENCALEFLSSRYQRHGNTFQSSILFSNSIHTIEPENVKTILATKFKQFDLGDDRRGAFHPLLGDGIFTADGSRWEHSRALLRPSFARSQIAATDLYERHTLDTATEFLFGESVESLSPGSSAASSNFAYHFNTAQDGLSFRMTIGPFKRLHFSPKFQESVREARGFVHGFVSKALAYRTELAAGKQPTDSVEPHPRYVFLQELAKKTNDTNELTDQLLNILLAGRDTTASLLSMVFFTLSRRPDMRYLSWVINETLRLYPVVPSNTRTANEDTILPVGGGVDGKSPVFVSKGQQVNYDVYSMHRRKDIYGPDADEFRPERWETLRPGWAFVPFNGGPRICLGQQFALTEASYTTVRILQSFKGIACRDAEPWREALLLTLASKNGTKVSMVPA
ncbi:hypothetical protein BBP40_009985 [Aspergillus hancockii]|nr:hypothetical protein BBP40_009985 [Aspergillus hancockii]